MTRFIKSVSFCNTSMEPKTTLSTSQIFHVLLHHL
uniref:Uncharacterized protein n=1 Tax=Anguilla anguilla TaxID=7936 RepID=A0A0E9TEZ1_ANGAN